MIRVLLVDDCKGFAKAYGKMMSRESDISLVGTLNSADRLDDETDRLSPDIVVMDLSMPGRDPLDAIAQLLISKPAVRSIICSGYDDDATAKRVADAGAWGIVPKVTNGELGDMFGVIRRVNNGERCFPRGIVLTPSDTHKSDTPRSNTAGSNTPISNTPIPETQSKT
jgi:DNA-binding NarL/FixJ family response regulator